MLLRIDSGLAWSHCTLLGLFYAILATAFLFFEFILADFTIVAAFALLYIRPLVCGLCMDHLNVNVDVGLYGYAGLPVHTNLPATHRSRCEEGLWGS